MRKKDIKSEEKIKIKNKRNIAKVINYNYKQDNECASGDGSYPDRTCKANISEKSDNDDLEKEMKQIKENKL